MALIVRDTNIVSLTGAYEKPYTSGLTAGEALDAASPCYIDPTSGQVFMCINTTLDDAVGGNPSYVGFNHRACAINEPVTLYGAGTMFHYAAGALTPGPLYISGTKGRLDDAPQTITDGVITWLKHMPVARVWDADKIIVVR
jgi:hypothetical protein